MWVRRGGGRVGWGVETEHTLLGLGIADLVATMIHSQTQVNSTTPHTPVRLGIAGLVAAVV